MNHSYLNWLEKPKKVDAFIKLMEPLGLIEVSRTGVVAIARGSETT